MIEAQAANAAELEHDYKQSIVSDYMLKIGESGTSAAYNSPSAEKAGVPAAKITVEVQDSNCRKEIKQSIAPEERCYDKYSKGEASCDELDAVKQQSLAGMITDVTGALMKESGSDAGSDSITTDYGADLEELD